MGLQVVKFSSILALTYFMTGGKIKNKTNRLYIHTTIYKIDNQQGHLYSTGSYIQYSLITYKEEESTKIYSIT